jgi:branched-chain amino acid transport system substrate-binding protein
MRKKQALVCAVLTALLVGSLLIGPATQVRAAEAKKLKVGALTNLGWSLGVDYKKFLDVIVPWFNEQGGVTIAGQKYEIDLILYDTKMNPETARAAVERLVNRDGVKFILGDETVDAWLPLTEQNKILVICSTPTSAMFNPKNRLVFQTAWMHTQPPVVWGWFAKNYPKAKTVMGAYPDNRIGHSLAERSQKMSQVFGMKMEDPTFFPPTTTEFGAIATKITRSNPDVFTTSGGGSLTDSMIYKALYESGFKGMLFTFNSVRLNDIAKVIPLSMVEGFVSAEDGIQLPNPPPVAKQVKDVYVAKRGSWDEPTNIYWHTWFCLMNGLSKAQSLDPEKVAAVMGNGMKFDTVAGPAVMVARPDMGNTRTVDIQLTAYMRKVEQGKAKILSTITLDEGYQYLKTFYGWK